MATVVQKTFTLVPSAESPPVARTVDPNGKVATRPLYTAPTFDSSVTAVQTAYFGDSYSQAVTLATGSGTPGLQFYKIDGPHEVSVNSSTGAVTWTIPSAFSGSTGFRGRAVRIGVRAVNGAGYADLYWIVVVGTSNILYVGPSETYTNLQAAYAAMSSGDTLIIRDGTYTGASNVTDVNNGPPGGTASQMTSVIAETPFNAILDGENARMMLTHSSNFVTARYPSYGGIGPTNRNYVMYDGIEIQNSNSSGFAVISGQYIYLKMMSTTHSGIPANQINGNAGQSVVYSDHVLMEDCIADGHQRYSFSPFRCTNVVFRRTIGRMDHYTGTDPIGGNAAYTCEDFSGFNLIQIDSDAKDWWTAHSYYAAAFSCPATGEESIPNGNEYKQCVSINCSYAVMDSYADSTTETTVFENIVGWGGDHHFGPVLDLLPGVIACRAALDMDKITIGRMQSLTPYPPLPDSEGVAFIWGWGQTSTLNDAILVELGWDRDTETAEDTGYIFDIGVGGALNVDDTIVYGAHALIKPVATGSETTLGAGVDEATNPYSNGLTYPVRIEPGSYLETAGAASGRMGANVLTMIGRPGLFKDETDWNTDDGTPMWPVPYQDALKEKFRRLDYTGVTKPTSRGGTQGGASAQLLGTRGFAADDQDLTSYIWGQIGNAVPSFNVRTFVSGSDVTVKWEPNQATAHRDKTVSYLVCRGDAAGDNRVLVATVEPDVFEYTETGLGAGTYTYWVETRHTSRGFSKHGYKQTTVVS